jgi:ribosome maturation factor RimP
MSPAARAKLDGAKLHEQLEPVVAELGFDLEEVNAQRAGSRQLLRVVVDGDDGITLDDIAEVSQAVSAALDASNAMGEGAYDLEVTSPGVSRPLTLPRHWRRAFGRLVVVPLTAGGEVTGRVVAADEEGVTLELPGKKPGTKGGERRLGFSELGRGKVQVEFNRPGAKDEGDEDLEPDEALDGEDADLEDDEAQDTDGTVNARAEDTVNARAADTAGARQEDEQG